MVDSVVSQLLGKGPCARDDAPYRLVEVRGPDAGEFLQRLCTQDVLGLADATTAPAAFLDAKGKVLATCVVFGARGTWWLETHAEQEERLAALLERYHFTEKLAIARRAPAPCQEHVSWASSVPAQDHRVEFLGDAPLVTFARRGLCWRRAHGARVESIARRDDGTSTRAAPEPLGADLAECLRMAAGLVRVGIETEPSTLALEADLDDHCSTTKGCYTGQEIVARIHTYGHVNRRLCLLHLAPGERIAAPQQLLEPDDGVAVGRVMHAVPVPGQAARLGLGYLPKDFQAVGTNLRLADGAAVRVIAFGAA